MRKYIFPASLISILSTMQVHATELADTSDTGNAIDDILLNPRYSGAISAIKSLTDFVDQYFVMVISFTAFFIISCAILKNVCAAAYCSYPKFFDKVDAAHKANEAITISTAQNYFTNKQFTNLSTGSLKNFILGFFPNFKAATDFEESDIEAKAYFLRAIPQMCLCVIIGIFIYNGYYRDTAATVGRFGSEAFVRVMTAADPTELLNRVTNTTGTPDFATDDATDQNSKLINDIAHKVYRTVMTRYTDIQTSAAKESMAAAIENWTAQQVATYCNAYTSDEDGSIYKWSGIDVVLTNSTIERENVKSSNDGDTVSIYWISDASVGELFGIDSTKASTDTRCRVTFTMSRKASTKEASKANSSSGTPGASGKAIGTVTVDVPMPATNSSATASSSGMKFYFASATPLTVAPNASNSCKLVPGSKIRGIDTFEVYATAPGEYDFTNGYNPEKSGSLPSIYCKDSDGNIYTVKIRITQ